MREPTTQDKEQFERDGCILLREVLTQEEVARYRTAVQRFFQHRGGAAFDGGLTQPDAFGHIPELRTLITHPNIGKAFRFYCGQRLVYCHHSDAHFNKYTGWHKDQCGTHDFAPGPDGESYGVYKMAFYLQDPTDGPPPLTVRLRSHITPELHRGAMKELRPYAGDAILFDCRISHKGAEMTLPQKVLARLLPAQRLKTALFSQMWRRRLKHDKYSLFFTFGLPNALTKEHVRITVARQQAQLGLGTYHLDSDVAAHVRQAGFDLAPYVQEQAGEGVHP